MNLYILATSLLFLFVAAPAFAQSDESLSLPIWYFTLEIFGSLICVLVLIGLLRISRQIGGIIGKLLATMSAGMGIITIALLFRSYSELRDLETFNSDLAFESGLYLGLLVIFIGVELAIKRIKVVKTPTHRL